MDRVEQIKRDALPRLMAATVYMIVATDYGFRVEHWTPDGVAPQFDYDTPQEAVARVMQVMGIADAVKPQDHPEPCCVGIIEKK